MLGLGGRRQRGIPGDLPEGTRVLLHVGCGPRGNEEITLHPQFQAAEWHEVRFDIDPGVDPDIVGTIVDMRGVPSASVDAIWSCHNIEHVYAHEVPAVFGEFFRVLRPGGFARLETPDLQQVAERIVQGLLDEPFARTGIGPIAALDIVYGHSDSIATEKVYMAHRTGYTRSSLERRLRAAGFAQVEVEQGKMELRAIGYRPR